MSIKHIPSYALYGHRPRAVLDEQMYLQWIEHAQGTVMGEIKAHQHEALLQLIYLAEGSGEVRIEGTQLHVQAPCVLLLPKRTVHALQFTPEANGVVVSVAQSQVEAMLRAVGSPLLAVLQKPLVLPIAEALLAPWLTMVEVLVAQIIATEQHLAGALGIFLALLAFLQRVAQGAEIPANFARKQALVEAFQNLVEQHYPKHWPLELYAQTLGVTSSKLFRVCRRELGEAPMVIVQRRVILEAQRQLAYADSSIKQIAAALGFSDYAYFSRYFKKHTGLSPSAFRESYQGKS